MIGRALEVLPAIFVQGSKAVKRVHVAVRSRARPRTELWDQGAGGFSYFSKNCWLQGYDKHVGLSDTTTVLPFSHSTVKSFALLGDLHTYPVPVRIRTAAVNSTPLP